MQDNCIFVSIVSHAHGDMVSRLVKQLLSCSQVLQVLVTCNVPEVLYLPTDPRVLLIKNSVPKGFGANHNKAFSYCTVPWFLVLNPDIVLRDNPFPALLYSASMSGAALLSPRAVSSSGFQEDCWRRFPTLWGLLRKLFGGVDGRYSLPTSDASAFPVDWVSGLCLFARREAYAVLGGFDERYFLYYEDVNICVCAWRAGFSVWACPSACLVHDAQRASRRNFRHLCWHLFSMLRYLLIQSWRLPRGGP